MRRERKRKRKGRERIGFVWQEENYRLLKGKREREEE